MGSTQVLIMLMASTSSLPGQSGGKKFYNNPPCEYGKGDASNLVSSWNKWTTSIPKTTSFFLGVPASSVGASSGFIAPATLKTNVLPQIKKSSKYAGVMLWFKFYDEQTQYSSSIKDSV
ncbi:hypothetical protein SUGI_0384580 [Cryptomeria japonica]|nr:hypothetical protein SUGI_0384580 [Cryptomeria japonica]